MGLSKTQLRSALRLYTSSWRYLYGIKAGAIRVDLDGNACGVLDEQHVEHARKQLEEAKARVQAQRDQQRAARREAGESEEGAAPRRPRKPAARKPAEGEAARKPRPQTTAPARVLKLKQAKVRWTLPFLKYQKTAFGSSSLPAWQ